MQPARLSQRTSCLLLGLALWLCVFAARAAEAIKVSALARDDIAVAQTIEVL